MAKRLLSNIGAFFLTLGVGVAALVLVCLIPQSAIRQSCTDAADYFVRNEKYPMVIEGYEATRVDNYADCVLLNVVWNVDAGAPLRSVIAAPYYRVESNAAQDDFISTVVDGKAPNNEYSRYWHGSQILIRPLLTVTSITGVRLILFGVLVALNAVLAAALLRRRRYAPAAIYFAALVLVGGWMTAFSLEYIMVFLVLAVLCIAVCRLWDDADAQRREGRMTRLFVVGGAVTCFMDFLTTETLTFTVPFILYMLLGRRDEGETAQPLRAQILRLIRWGAAWLISYAAAFAVKWALVYCTMGGDALRNALESAAYRIDGNAAANVTLSAAQQMLAALVQNLSCLLPLPGSHSIGFVLLVSACVPLVLGMVLYLFRGERLDGAFVVVLLIVGAIPYLRYVVLSNHACMHYFFTYRAQMATIMALAAIMVYQMKPSYILSQRKGGKPSKKRK